MAKHGPGAQDPRQRLDLRAEHFPGRIKRGAFDEDPQPVLLIFQGKRCDAVELVQFLDDPVPLWGIDLR